MLQPAVQKRVVDLLGGIAEETGVDRQEIYRFIAYSEYVEPPPQMSALDQLQSAEQDRLAGDYGVPVEETIAEGKRIIALAKDIHAQKI
jgi:hypothetical protein